MNKSFFIHVKQTLLLWVVFVFPLSAQIPTGYYQSAEGKSGARLKTALYKIINPHTVKSYDDLWTYWPTTDCMTANTSQVWDMYSSTVTYFSNHSSIEKEHCVPKSWWNEDDIVTSTGAASIEYSDMFNLYPANADANQAKLNYPLSEVSSGSLFDNGVSKVGPSNYSGYTGTAFEPADEYKGDFARTYLYMATCYQFITTWNTYSYCMFANTTYPTLRPWAVSLLLKWNTEDPVSTKETTRNNKVYAIQGNRNPYIDHPEMVGYIWGDTTTTWSATASKINEIKDSELKMYYAQEIFTIKNPFSVCFTYKLIKMDGQVLYSSTSSALEQQIFCDGLSHGVYFVQVSSSTTQQTKKFIK